MAKWKSFLKELERKANILKNYVSRLCAGGL